MCVGHDLGPVLGLALERVRMRARAQARGCCLSAFTSSYRFDSGSGITVSPDLGFSTPSGSVRFHRR